MRRPITVTAEFLVTVDPGLYNCGVAVFKDRVLIAATETGHPEGGVGTSSAVVWWAETAIKLRDGSPSLAQWVSETPQDYDGDDAKTPTLDALRAVVTDLDKFRSRNRGAGPVRTLFPHAWKGNVPKQVSQDRIVALLAEPERRVVDLLDRTRDALDAVGVGLFVLGRAARGMVPV